MNTHDLIIDFGKHKGERWTRIPIDYLNWIINTTEDSENKTRKIAESEVNRRGSFIPTLDISPHAINKASLRCMDIWERTRKENEGLHAWLHRMAEEALLLAPGLKAERIIYNNMRLVFNYGSCYPALKTIMKVKE